MARREPRDGWGRTPGKLVAPYRCCKTLPFHNLDVSVDASLEGPFNDAQAETEGTKRSLGTLHTASRPNEILRGGDMYRSAHGRHDASSRDIVGPRCHTPAASPQWGPAVSHRVAP